MYNIHLLYKSIHLYLRLVSLIKKRSYKNHPEAFQGMLSSSSMLTYFSVFSLKYNHLVGNYKVLSMVLHP